MTDLTKAVMQAKTPLEYLRAEVALLRDMDDTSGDADWMEKAADQIEGLRAIETAARNVFGDGGSIRPYAVEALEKLLNSTSVSAPVPEDADV